MVTWPTELPSTKTSSGTPSGPTWPTMKPVKPTSNQPLEWTPVAITFLSLFLITLLAVFTFFAKKEIQKRRNRGNGPRDNIPLMGYQNLAADVAV